MTENRETNYLYQLLQMNPLEQSMEILARRRNFIQPQAKLDTSIDDMLSFDERREQVSKKIEKLRKNFWSLKKRMLYQQLEEIDASEFPDLAAALSRLRKIAELRASFQRLRQHHACFEDFHNQFCTLVIASPGKADELRTALLEGSHQQAADFDFQGPEDYHRAATVIKQEFPELYQLEKYWLNQVATSTKQQSSIRRTVRLLYFSISATLGISLLLCLMYVLGFVNV